MGKNCLMVIKVFLFKYKFYLSVIMVTGMVVNCLRFAGNSESVFIVSAIQILSMLSIYSYMAGEDLVFFSSAAVSKEGPEVLRFSILVMGFVFYFIMFFY